MCAARLPTVTTTPKPSNWSKKAKSTSNRFITQRIKLDELVSEGFERLIHNNESAVKIIVSPNL